MLKCISIAAVALAITASAPAQGLTIGSPAPRLVVKRWVRGDPIQAFQFGRTYVVEFWATWCGPCRKSIPHVSELQKKYKDKVTVVGVSIWEDDPSQVQPFVEKMGDTMAYTVAMDEVPDKGSSRDGKMAKSWMSAAGEDGIPSAFIVDGTGKVAWIGHPLELDEPLAKVVAGDWKIETAAAARKAAKEAGAKRAAAMRTVQEAIDAKDYPSALAALDGLIQADPKIETKVGPKKFKLLLDAKRYEDAYAYGHKLVDGAARDSAQALNAIAWTIVDPDAGKLEKRDLKLALKAAQRADELTQNQDAAVLDTLAKVHFDSGEVSKAVEVQKKAVAQSKGTELEEELTKRLAEYEQSLRKQGG